MNEDAIVWVLESMGTETYVAADTLDEALAIAEMDRDDLDSEPYRTNAYEASSMTDEILGL